MTTIFSQITVGKNSPAQHLRKRVCGFLFIFIFSFSLTFPNVSSAQSVDLPGVPYVTAKTGSCAAGANKISLSFAQDILGPATDYYLSRSPFSAVDSGWGTIQHATNLSDLLSTDTTSAAGTRYSYQIAAVGPGGTRYSSIISANTLATGNHQVTQDIVFSPATNDWTAHGTLNYFNPALGTLTSLQLQHFSDTSINQKVENVSSHPITVAGSALATSTLTFSGHTSKIYFSSLFGPTDIATYDGVTDYAGGSAYGTGTTTASKQAATITITDPAELATFTGTSGGMDVTENVSTQATSYVVIGANPSGPFSYFPLTLSTNHVIATYNYTNALCDNPAATLVATPSSIVRNTSSDPLPQTSQITQTLTFSGSSRPVNISLNYFDPAFGSLTSVKISRTTVFSPTFKGENLSGNPMTVHQDINATSSLAFPGRGLTRDFLYTFGPFDLTPYDGVKDFGGTSGVTAAVNITKQSDDVIITDPTELTNYIGSSGTIDITESLLYPVTVYTGSTYNQTVTFLVSGTIVVTYGYASTQSNLNWTTPHTGSSSSFDATSCQSPGTTGATAIPAFPSSGSQNLAGGSWVKPTDTTVYGVTCYNANGDSASETAIVRVVDPTGKPHVTSSTPSCGLGTGKIALSYSQDGTGAVTDYYLSRSPYSVPDSNPSSGWGDIFHATSLAGLLVTDTGLTPGASYQYQIMARGPGGDSWSDISTLTSATDVCPPLQVSCSVTQPLSGVDLAANPPTDVTWTALPSGGSSSYSYVWTGDYPLNTKTSAVNTLNYAGTVAGEKYGFVTVTDTSNPPITFGPIACGMVNVTDSNASFDLSISSLSASLKFLSQGAVSNPIRVTVAPESGFSGGVTISAPSTVVVGGVTMNISLRRHASQALVTSPVTLSGASEFADGLDVVLSSTKTVPAGNYPNAFSVTGDNGNKSVSKNINLDTNLVKPVFEEF